MLKSLNGYMLMNCYIYDIENGNTITIKAFWFSSKPTRKELIEKGIEIEDSEFDVLKWMIDEEVLKKAIINPEEMETRPLSVVKSDGTKLLTYLTDRSYLIDYRQILSARAQLIQKDISYHMTTFMDIEDWYQDVESFAKKELNEVILAIFILEGNYYEDI